MPPYLPLNAIFDSKLKAVVRSAPGLTISGRFFISSLPRTARRLLSRQVGTVQASVANRR
jgi:hypothetical protein